MYIGNLSEICGVISGGGGGGGCAGGGESRYLSPLCGTNGNRHTALAMVLQFPLKKDYFNVIELLATHQLCLASEVIFLLNHFIYRQSYITHTSQIYCS